MKEFLSGSLLQDQARVAMHAAEDIDRKKKYRSEIRSIPAEKKDLASIGGTGSGTEARSSTVDVHTILKYPCSSQNVPYMWIQRGIT